MIASGCNPLGVKSSSNTKLPPPVIQGQWPAQFSYQLGTASAVTVSATLAMSTIDSAGNFSGAFTLAAPYAGSGMISGTYVPPGPGIAQGTAAFTVFGDSGRPLLFQGALFATLYPTCDFSNAQGFGGGGYMTGAAFNASNDLTGIACTSGGVTTMPALTATMVAARSDTVIP